MINLKQLLGTVFVISRITKLGLVKVYQAQPSASAENPLFNLDFSGSVIIVNYWIALRFPSGDKKCTVDTALN